MAQADFDFVTGGLGGSMGGGPDGAAMVHAALSSPLTGEGVYCRRFSPINSTLYSVNASIKASVAGGLFDAIPVTKSISLRAWLRSENYLTGTAIGIVAKMHPDANANARENAVGYTLGFGSWSDTLNNNSLKLHMRSTNSVYKNVYLKTLSTNTWYKVRLDVIPTGSSFDTINVYTGTGATGSEIWTLEHTEIVLNSAPHYVPWAQSGGGKVGWNYRSEGSSAGSVYIDRFEAYLEDV